MSAFISVIAALVLLSNSSPLVGEQSFSLDVRVRQQSAFVWSTACGMMITSLRARESTPPFGN